MTISPLLFNVGQAYRLGGDNASAIRAYRSYLRRVPNAENRGEVERLLSLLTSERKQPPPEAATVAPPKPTETPQSPTASTKASTPSATAVPSSPAPTAETAITKTSPKRRPVYKRWWLWTIAGVVIVGGAVTAAVVATTPNNAKAPSGALTISFP